MAYSTDTILYLPFDSYPFIESVNSITGNSHLATPILETFRFNTGYRMGSNWVDFSGVPNLTTAFSFGFWLRPNCPGLVLNPSTSATETLNLALFSKCLFTVVGSTTNISNVNFIVYEQTQSNNQNVMVVQLSNGAQLTTSPYNADIDHYFWIVYNGGNTSLVAYIDLILDSSVITGTIPASLTATTENFAINKGAGAGSTYNRAYNNGLIDDLIVFNTAKTSVATMQKAANMGASYIADTVLSNTQQIDQVIVFDDPTTIQNNGVFSTRHEFGNPKELSSITVKRRGNTTESVSDGKITLTNEVIRI
jgi:hypothetical protein